MKNPKNHKEKARAYFSAVSHYEASSVEGMLDENYIQHNPHVPTGRAAFLSLLPKLQHYGSKIRNIRMLEDGDHVIMHHRWEHATPFGYDQAVAFHIIRFDSQALIAEHWNVMMEDLPSVGSRNSLTDGTTRIEDLHKTDENKGRIAELFETLTAPSRESRPFVSVQFFHDTFLKRNPSLSFESPVLHYRKQHKVFGEGNFTLSICEAIQKGIPSAIYDLFRLESGKIAEHWSIAQDIPQKNLANANTMFGF